MNKSYYAIIPANVRYDDELTPNAKLLYGEITALCNEKGYCWATNNYFAELYGVSKTSISKWIKQLIDKGYIKSQIKYHDGTKEIKNRYLYIGSIPIEEKLKGCTTNINDPIEEKLNTPIEEKLKDNNTLINTTINTTTTTTSSDSDFNIFKYAEMRNFILSPIQAQKLQEDINIYSLEEVKKALDIADDNGKHTYSYVKGILQKRRSGSDKKRSSEEEFEKLRQKALETGEEPF